MSKYIFKNYRKISEVHFEKKPLTIFTGQNGSGKSTVFECVKLIRDLYEKYGLDLEQRGKRYGRNILFKELPDLKDKYKKFENAYIEAPFTIRIPEIGIEKDFGDELVWNVKRKIDGSIGYKLGNSPDSVNRIVLYDDKRNKLVELTEGDEQNGLVSYSKVFCFNNLLKLFDEMLEPYTKKGESLFKYFGENKKTLEVNKKNINQLINLEVKQIETYLKVEYKIGSGDVEVPLNEALRFNTLSDELSQDKGKVKNNLFNEIHPNDLFVKSNIEIEEIEIEPGEALKDLIDHIKVMFFGYHPHDSNRASFKFFAGINDINPFQQNAIFVERLHIPSRRYYPLSQERNVTTPEEYVAFLKSVKKYGELKESTAKQSSTDYADHTGVTIFAIHDSITNWLNAFQICDDIEVTFYDDLEVLKFKLIKGDKKFEVGDLSKGEVNILMLVMLMHSNYSYYLKFKSTDLDNVSLDPLTLYIEEPEMNLHPNFQSRLADLIVDAHNKFGVRFVIETHSEYLIRKLQYLVAKQDESLKLKSNDVVIYYFEKEDGSSYRIDIQENGYLSREFGPGFLDEADNLSLNLFFKHQSN